LLPVPEPLRISKKCVEIAIEQVAASAPLAGKLKLVKQRRCIGCADGLYEVIHGLAPCVYSLVIIRRPGWELNKIGLRGAVSLDATANLYRE
jgi:hypothetical protein